ncbi:MAG: acyl-CoA dehydratase activase [Desulfobacterales bacterium]|nr:acyl-CoA dehydratase activase [Desulfobacterales bacterium]
MIYAGIDIGSITAKAALIKGDKILGTHTIPTGFHHLQAGEKVFGTLLEKTNLSHSQVSGIVSTGYGRASIKFADTTMTEILCHGAGAFFINPDIRGIIDVGGQDSKAILLDADGRVDNFAMNDKCAAGTGRFLEVMARALDVELDQMGEVGLTSGTPAKISSICTVFAESEVISMIANQEKREDIIAGIHDSAAARVAGLARKVKIREPIMMTGGVARNKGMVHAIQSHINADLIVSKISQETGAVGAAVLASQLAPEAA